MSDEKKSDPPPSPPNPPAKKPYVKPKLNFLGSVRELTLGSGSQLPDADAATFRDVQ